MPTDPGPGIIAPHKAGSAVTLTRNDLRQLLVGAGFKKNSPDTETMIAIAYAESRGKPDAHNDNPKTGDESYGLWQINMIGKLGPQRRAALHLKNNAELFDPATNARAAKWVYDNQGLEAWSTYKRGDYLKYASGTTGYEDGKDTESSQPLSGLDGITGGLNALGANLFKGAANLSGIIVAIVLLVLGVVILASQSKAAKQVANAATNIVPGGAVVKGALKTVTKK